MAQALPVVGSRWPGLAEVISDNDSGYLVRPGDPMAVARRTRQLLDDPEFAGRMGAAGYLRARQLFSVDAFLSAWQRAVA